MLAERKQYNWSPFVRLTNIIFKYSDAKLVEHVAQTYALYLRQHLLTSEISPVQAPSVARIEGQYIRQIVCRRPYNVSYIEERKAFRWAMMQLYQYLSDAKKVQIIYNVDPL